MGAIQTINILMAERHGHQEYGDCPQVLHSDECGKKAWWVLGTVEGLLRNVDFDENGHHWVLQPLIDFKYEVIETRMNSMFELATIDEIDKLRTADGNTDSGKSSDELSIGDLEVNLTIWYNELE